MAEVKKGRFAILKLEEGIAPAVVKSTFSVKIPGPTDAVVTTATNPAGNEVPGQQDTTLVKNRLAR
jgi:hypothetical protein